MADPFTTGLLAVTAAQNPAVAADALSLIGGEGGAGMPGFLGVGQGLGQFLGGAGGASGFGGIQPGIGGLPGGGLNLGQGLQQFLPGAGAQVAGAGGELQGNQASQSPLAGLQGFKGPEPVKPEFAGGIRGAQQAPQPQLGGLNPAPILQMLQGLLAQGQGAGAVPNLGALLRGA